MISVFVDVHSSDNRELALRSACKPMLTSQPDRFSLDVRQFRGIPGSPFAYSSGKAIVEQFEAWSPLAASGLVTRQGLATADDYRFARLHWEIASPGSRWVGFAKGGRYSTYYSDVSMVVDREPGFRQMAADLAASGSPRSNIWMLSGTIQDHFGSPALRWTRTALGNRRLGFGLTVLPNSNVFNDKSCCIFEGNSDVGLLETLALLSSCVVDRLMRTISPTRSWEVGHVRRLPFAEISGPKATRLADLAHQGWSLKRSLDTVVEVSHAFVVPAVLQVRGAGFGDRVAAWAERVASTEAALAHVQSEIDELCFELYGISEEDRRAITEGFGVSDDSDDAAGDDDDANDDSGVELDPVGLAAGLVSWAVGVAVGRFDVRLATGERGWPVEPDPFDPLPVCSSAMLTGDDGLPVKSPPDGYPVGVSSVLVDDPGHDLDLTGRVRDVFDVVFGESADRWWADVGAVLDSKSGDVETWLRKGSPRD